ncbi:MAG: phage major capsid protein, partial [Acidimicrobiales bacterium]|nr:phage major capsid protein [Acidimicrobiales bacterium]
MSTISDSIRSLTSDELRDRRAELVDEARTLVRSDVDLTGDDAERFDALTAEIDDIDKLIARHDEIARLAGLGNVTMGDGAAASAPALHRNRDPWAERATTPHDARELALRAIDATSAPDHAKATASALARTEGLAARWARATSNPHYLTAFHKLWNDPARGHLEWSTAERGAHVAVAELQRSMSLTGTAGGYLVPFTLDPSILLTGDGSTNPMRQIARVVQTATNQWSGVSSAGVTASWDAEGAQVSDDTPTLAQPAIDTHKGAAFIPFSIEVGMDAPGFATECAKLLVDAKDQLEATTFVTGNGTTAPKGLVTALDGTASEVA